MNGEPHLGHIAGVNIPADIFARYHRVAGNDVVMVSGSDMHGTPTTLRALDENVSPESIATHYHGIWSDCLERMGISYDLYTHTHTDNHREVVQDMFSRLYEKGYIYEASQTMPYSETEQRFLSDRFVEGVCPHCSSENARGDQCESCGRTLDPSDLINIRSKRDGSALVFKETKHLFLRLSGFQSTLEKWLEGKSSWRPTVRNQTLGMLTDGLRDRAITRDIEWGVPVPIEGYDSKRVYVWFEAVIGYLSATIEWSRRNGEQDAWKRFWMDNDAETYYFQGKDNIPFHTIIWPAMLTGYGGINLPTDVSANEFLNLGEKFSKSRGNAIWLKDYLARYEPEPLRYYLAAIMPETSDSEFKWEGFVNANNNTLVATYGNFIHRTLSLVYRNFDGKVPEPGSLDERDKEALKACDEALKNCAENIDKRHFRDALRHAMNLAQHGNIYMDRKAPWAQVKEDRDAAATTLWVGMNIAATLRTVFYPYLPFSSQSLHKMLGFTGTVEADGWQRVKLQPNSPICNPIPLFKKIDEEVIQQELTRMR